jgi:hypothetical protein
MAFYRLLGRTGEDPSYGTPPCARTPHRAVRPKSPSCGAARGGTRWMLLAAAHCIAGGASGEHIVFAFYKRASLATNAARRAASTETAVQGVAHGQAWAAAQRVPRGFAAHSARRPATTAANRAETLARRTANRAEMLARRTANRAEMLARLHGWHCAFSPCLLRLFCMNFLFLAAVFFCHSVLIKKNPAEIGEKCEAGWPMLRARLWPSREAGLSHPQRWRAMRIRGLDCRARRRARTTTHWWARGCERGGSISLGGGTGNRR